MASPPPPHQTGSNSPYFFYFVLAVAIAAVLFLVSCMIAAGCCSTCSIVEDIRRFLRSRGHLGAGEIDDEQIPGQLPVFKYRKEQAQELECSVCLSVFVDGEDVRQLPRCKHSFHAPCIDMWLYSHSSCPLCRADVLGRPLPSCQTADGRGGEISMQQYPIEPRGASRLVVAMM